jgi:hypothetical protein
MLQANDNYYINVKESLYRKKLATNFKACLLCYYVIALL